MKELGIELKKARLQKGLGLNELSIEIYGNSNWASKISSLERGMITCVRFETIEKLLKYFDLNIINLLKEKNDMASIDIISASVIENTFTYIMLGEVDPNKPLLNHKIHQSLLLKRQSRELITNALNVWRNTGVIPNNVSGYQLKIVEELIEAEKQDSES